MNAFRFSNWPTPLKWIVGIAVALLLMSLGSVSFYLVMLVGIFVQQIVTTLWLPMLAVALCGGAFGAYNAHKDRTSRVRGFFMGILWTTLVVVIAVIGVSIWASSRGFS